MGAEPERGRVEPFFFDRNLGKRVPDALAERDWLVVRHDDHFGHETPDETLLREIAARKWIFITQDRRIRYRAAERLALVEAGVATFVIVSTANLSAADTIDVLVRAEANIFAAVEAESRPFLIGVYKDGSIRRLV